MPAVVKRQGGTEPFDREKIVSALRRVSRGRPVGAGAATKLVDLSREVEVALSRMKLEKVPSLRVAELLVQRLEEIDRVVWDRFASNYRREDGSSLFEPEPASPRARQLGLFPGKAS